MLGLAWRCLRAPPEPKCSNKTVSLIAWGSNPLCHRIASPRKVETKHLALTKRLFWELCVVFLSTHFHKICNAQWKMFRLGLTRHLEFATFLLKTISSCCVKQNTTLLQSKTLASKTCFQTPKILDVVIEVLQHTLFEHIVVLLAFWKCLCLAQLHDSFKSQENCSATSLMLVACCRSPAWHEVCKTKVPNRLANTLHWSLSCQMQRCHPTTRVFRTNSCALMTWLFSLRYTKLFGMKWSRFVRTLEKLTASDTITFCCCIMFAPWLLLLHLALRLRQNLPTLTKVLFWNINCFPTWVAACTSTYHNARHSFGEPRTVIATYGVRRVSIQTRRFQNKTATLENTITLVQIGSPGDFSTALIKGPPWLCVWQCLLSVFKYHQESEVQDTYQEHALSTRSSMTCWVGPNLP